MLFSFFIGITDFIFTTKRILTNSATATAYSTYEEEYDFIDIKNGRHLLHSKDCPVNLYTQCSSTYYLSTAYFGNSQSCAMKDNLPKTF